MSLTDPLADMFTRIRNAIHAKFDSVDVPSSKLKEAIAEILKKEGYILDYSVLPDTKQNVLRINLKYLEDKTNAIDKIKRISKPSMRVYVKKDAIQPIRLYSGIAILSTTHGILADHEARARGVGGEVLCEVW